MATPTAPRDTAALDVPLADVEARTAEASAREGAAKVAACHDAELAAGNPQWAHEVDPLDDGRLYRFADGYPTGGAA